MMGPLGQRTRVSATAVTATTTTVTAVDAKGVAVSIEKAIRRSAVGAE